MATTRWRRSGGAALVGLVLGYVGARGLPPVAPPAPPVAAPAEVPGEEDRRVAEAWQEVEAAVVAVTSPRTGPVGRDKPAFRRANEILLRPSSDDPDLPVRMERMLSALQSWMERVHPPGREPCCGELDTLAVPIEMQRGTLHLVEALEELAAASQKFDRLLLLGRGDRVAEVRVLFDGLARISEDSLRQLLKTWRRPPLLAIWLAVEISTRIWTEGLAVAIGAAIERLPEVDPATRRRLALVLFRAGWYSDGNLMLLEEDRLRLAGALDRESARLFEAEPGTAVVLLAAEGALRSQGLRSERRSFTAGIGGYLPRVHRALTRLRPDAEVESVGLLEAAIGHIRTQAFRADGGTLDRDHGEELALLRGMLEGRTGAR